MASNGLFFHTISLGMARCISAEGELTTPSQILGEEKVSALPALLLVEPCAKLLLCSSWRSLAFLARWRFSDALWTDWPPVWWIQGGKGVHFHPQASSANAASLALLVDDLRRWAPLVCGGEVFQLLEEGDPGHDMLRLERHLELLDGMVEEIHPCVRGDAWGPEAAVKPRARYGGGAILSAVLAAKGLTSMANLRKDFQRMMRFLSPCLRELPADATSATGFIQLPAWDHKLVLACDAGVMEYRRRHVSPSAGPRYALCDSSPLAGRDWLMSKVRHVREERLVPAFEAMVRLAQGAGALADNEDGEAEADALEDDAAHDLSGDEPDEPLLPPPRPPPPTRAELYAAIVAAVSICTCVPMALELGHTALVHKVSALLFTLFLEAGLAALEEYLGTFISVTSDMGTELGVADLLAELHARLQNYVKASSFQTGEEEGSGDVDEQARAFIFRNTLTVSGILHICSNASKQVYKCLTFWTDLYECLKTLEKLF